MRNETNILRYLFALGVLGSILAPMVFGSAATEISSQLFSLCSGIKSVIGLLAIVLLLLGALFYAFSHLVPASGNLKGSMQGWALNMIVGAAIALFIYFIASWIALQILSIGSASASAGFKLTAPNC
jgi:hypothetical protein